MRALVHCGAVYYEDASRMAGQTRWRAWGVLALYVVVLYGLLPLGPTIGLGAIRTAPGAWLLGPGAVRIAPRPIAGPRGRSPYSTTT